MKKGKVWGETTALLKTPLLEIHRLTIYAYRRCSLHKHERKWNAFYVTSGTLYIEAKPSGYNLTDVTVLKPGDFTTLPPGEFHRFYTEDTVVECLEVYYPDMLSEDIIRKTIGGKII